MITLKPVTYDDVVYLLNNLRPGDAAEVAKGGILTPEACFDVCNNEDSFSVFADDGELICIYGVHPHPQDSDLGIVWLLGTPALDRYLFALCKRAKVVVEGWLTKYKVLSNITDAQNRRILMWLRWLGFRFRTTVNVNGHPFIQFVKARHV